MLSLGHILAIIFIITTLVAFSPSIAEAKSFTIYIAEMPKNWEADYGGIMYEATQYWEKEIPGTNFYQTTNREKADFGVQWASQYQGTKLGYWTPFTNNDWGIPYIAITLGYMDGEDVAWQDRKFNRVDPDYALLITIHEIGHAIGLGHSVNPNSIMYNFIDDYQSWLLSKDNNFESTPKNIIEGDYSVLAPEERAVYEGKLIALVTGINQATDTLTGIVHESQDAQEKIDFAWAYQSVAVENFEGAEKKYDVGIYELEKQNFRTAYVFFKSIDSNAESIGIDLVAISKLIDEAEVIEKKYQSQKQPNEKEKTCFLVWCW